MLDVEEQRQARLVIKQAVQEKVPGVEIAGRRDIVGAVRRGQDARQEKKAEYDNENNTVLFHSFTPRGAVALISLSFQIADCAALRRSFNREKAR
jgi:hypothetical protein